MIKAISNYGDNDWEDTGIECVLTVMKEPNDGTLFHIEERGEEEGNECIYFNKVAREIGEDERVILQETFGLITTDHEMPFLFDDRLSRSVAVHGESFTKIDLICGQPNVATEQIILRGFDMSICATYMDLTDHSFFIHSPSYSCNKQTILLNTFRNRIFLSYMNNLRKCSHMSAIDINKFLNDQYLSSLLPSGPILDAESHYKNIEVMVMNVLGQYFPSMFDTENPRWSHLHNELNKNSVPCLLCLIE